MVLGLLPIAGGSIRDLQRTGQHTRLLEGYLRPYAAAFERVHYFSYADEALADYTDDADLLARVTLWPQRGRLPYRLYSALLPLVYRKQMCECSVLRVFQTTGALPAWVARALYGVPYVVTYGYRYGEVARLRGGAWAARRLALVERIVLRHAAAVIVTTGELAAHVRTHVAPQRIHLIPNGVDTLRFAPGEAHEPRGEAARDAQHTVCFVGRLERQKNLELLIDAFAGLSVPARLLLVGAGSLREPLAAQAERQGVMVDFAGVVPNAELPRILHGCAAFVLPSLIEGHPKALLEAMACGLPCVASDCPGNREVITDGHDGLLFPSGDRAALRECLEQVLSQPDLTQRLGRAARQTVLERFDLARLVSREIALLQDVAASTDRGGPGRACR